MHDLLPIVVLVVASAPRGSKADLQYIETVHWLRDPEPPTTIRASENRWTSLNDNAKYVGLTFAGRTEFNWIVDIRYDKKTQEWWCVGNLVNRRSVLTTCRCIEEMGDINTNQNTPRVFFGVQFLYEYMLVPNPVNLTLGGTRRVTATQKHSLCNSRQHYYDAGLLLLGNEIPTYQTPTIGVMPHHLDQRTGSLTDMNLPNMAKTRVMCYVGSFGRDYANIKNTIVKNWKVRYRVYYEPFDLCHKNKERMCPNRHIKDCNIGGGNPKVEGKELMCFQARAKVGVVCDHDRGAPLVCDGFTVGLVVLGAREDRCNDQLQVPFWVQKIGMLFNYFEPNQKGGFKPFDQDFDIVGETISGDTSTKPLVILQIVISTIILWNLLST